jgi:hypothetical protein
MTTLTHSELAADFALWSEYVDRFNSREVFDAMTMDERLAQIAECFGPEVVPTVDDVLDRCCVGNDRYAWSEAGGSFTVTEAELRQALETAYDETMPNWPATVDLCSAIQADA